jgi:hypothetical protein
MHLHGLLESPVEELIRLTMLALLTTAFKVPGRKLPYDWVVQQLADVYAKAAESLIELDKSLYLWIVISTAFTVTGAQEYWIRAAWEQVEMGLDWPALKNHLMRVVWIEILHDEQGKRVFQQLEGSRIFDRSGLCSSLEPCSDWDFVDGWL